MVNSERIAEFIRESFEEFGLNYGEYFSCFDEDSDEVVEFDLIQEDGTINPLAIEVASEVLGFREKDIYAAREKAINRWFKKFPFFSYLGEYRYAYERSFYDGEAYDNIKLIEAIFENKINMSHVQRYSFQSIRERLIEQLKTIDRAIPGTFHEDAEMMDLKITTANICHYDKILDMVQAFFDMYSRAGELFFKALDQELEEMEIHEYNIIVSTLRIKDIFIPHGYLYYNNLCRCREIYRQEGFSRFQDYVRVTNYKQFRPWLFAGFIENREVVDKYLDIVPEAKGMMRKDAMMVSQFECFFTWSDAHHIVFSSEEEAMLLDAPDYYTPIEERALEPTLIYVPKSGFELDGDDYFAQQLLMYARSENKGGIKVRKPRRFMDNKHHAMLSRIGKITRRDFVAKNGTIVRSASHGGDGDV